jgi:hypothetical protein
MEAAPVAQRRTACRFAVDIGCVVGRDSDMEHRAYYRSHLQITKHKPDDMIIACF